MYEIKLWITASFLSFPRVCLVWRARNPENDAWLGEKTRILRAAATRENDRANPSTRA
jgi:hypothetical protein